MQLCAVAFLPAIGQIAAAFFEGTAAKVVSLIVVSGAGDILTASENGYGKRTPAAEYPRKGRGTQGVIALQTSERNGSLVGAIQLTEEHEILLISDQGTLVRTRAAEVSQVGRNTQGVTLMRVAEGEKLCAVEGEGIEGVICGRAIYNGALDFAKAQARADELNGEASGI